MAIFYYSYKYCRKYPPSTLTRQISTKKTHLCITKNPVIFPVIQIRSGKSNENNLLPMAITKKSNRYGNIHNEVAIT